MVYYVSDVTAAWERAKRGYIDEGREYSMSELPYADSENLDLSVIEKEEAYAIGHGYRIIPEGAPKAAYWTARGKDYAITDMAAIDGCPVVSEKFRTLVERFEPGVHQFIPVEIYDKAKGGDLIGTWYWLNICNRIDSTDHEKMKAVEWYWKPNYAGERSHWLFEGCKSPPLFFDQSKLSGVTLWVDPFLRPGGNFFATDAFTDAGRSEGLTGVTFTQREGV